jgi:hypothetical protein
MLKISKLQMKWILGKAKRATIAGGVLGAMSALGNSGKPRKVMSEQQRAFQEREREIAYEQAAIKEANRKRRRSMLQGVAGPLHPGNR